MPPFADYLRDNLTQAKAGLVMRDFNFAVVDEVDSILIDEARTPLIISGTAGVLSILLTSISIWVPL